MLYDKSADEIITHIMDAKTPYETLGLEPNCSENDIRTTSKKIAMKIHPDHCKNPNAEECTKKLNGSKELLLDPRKRESYDQGNKSVWEWSETEESHGCKHFAFGIDSSGKGFIVILEDLISPIDIIYFFLFPFEIAMVQHMERVIKKAENIKKEESKGNVKKEMFYQSICYLIPLCLTYIFIKLCF